MAADPNFEEDLRMYMKKFADDSGRNGWLSMAWWDYRNHFPLGLKVTRAMLDLRDMVEKKVWNVKSTPCVVGYVADLPGQSSL